MSSPTVSIIIATHNRPELLPRAVASALAQTIEDLEVVVVDDGSTPPARVPDDPRVRLMRLSPNQGVAAALSAGARAARGRYLTHLDDDDRLLPTALQVVLDALAQTNLPQPVVALSGIEFVDEAGQVTERRLPPTRARGQHFSLEPLEPGRAYETRNTLFADRQLLLSVGLWDESLRSRMRHDLLLRLNPVCSILGVHEVTYQAFIHRGERSSRNLGLKHDSFVQLERKHRALFRAHPARYAHYLRLDAHRLLALGRRREGAVRFAQALRFEPAATAAELKTLLRRRLRRRPWKAIRHALTSGARSPRTRPRRPARGA